MAASSTRSINLARKLTLLTPSISAAGSVPMRAGAGAAAAARARRARRILPGFGPSLGFTLFYLSLLVLIPLAGIFLRSSSMGWEQLWNAVASPRAFASYRLTVRRVIAGREHQRRVRVARGMGPGAIPVTAHARARCTGRSSVCNAHCGRRDRAHGCLLSQRLARAIPRAAWRRGGVHAPRRAGCADVHRIAVRRA